MGFETRLRTADAGHPCGPRRRPRRPIPVGARQAGPYVEWHGGPYDRSRRSPALVDANDACVRYNVFAGPGRADRADEDSAEIFVGAGTGKTRANDNPIYKNEIHGFGDADSSGEDDNHGVLIGAGSTSTWLLESEIADNGGDVIQAGGTHMSGDTRPQSVYIAGNRMYSNPENAVDIKRARAATTRRREH